MDNLLRWSRSAGIQKDADVFPDAAGKTSLNRLDLSQNALNILFLGRLQGNSPKGNMLNLDRCRS